MWIDEHEFRTFGWYQQHAKFCLGNFVYSTHSGTYKPRVTPAKLAPYLQPIAAGLGPSKDGNLADWSAAASMLFGPSSTEQAWMVLASFAAPLLSFTKYAARGYLAAVHGKAKGGKTAALVGAATVWGDPEALAFAPSDTWAAKLARVQHLGSLPAVDISLGSRDPLIARQFLTDFMAGPPAHQSHPWSTVALAECGQSIFGSIEQGHWDEIPPATSPVWYGFDLWVHVNDRLKMKGKVLENTLRHNRGHAGHAFMSWLILPHSRKWVREKIAGYLEVLKDRRAIGTGFYAPRIVFLACCLTAADAVRETGILEVSTERLLEHVSSTGLLGSPFYGRKARVAPRKPSSGPESQAASPAPEPASEPRPPEPGSGAQAMPPAAEDRAA